MALGAIKTLWVEFAARTKEFDKKIAEVSDKVEAAGKKMEAMGSTLTKRVSVPLTLMAAGAVKAFADFDDAMNQSIAIMGDVSQAMRTKMSDAAKDVARQTTISATQAAESYFFLASAGLDAEQSIAALPQVAKFAQAGMFDMATATDLATDAQSALGLTAEDAEENLKNLTNVTDVLVKANTLANASVEQFAEALTNRAAASARQVGKDVEEVTAVLAAMADQGVKGQLAGNQLAIVMRNLQSAALDNRDAFRESNVEVFDSQGKMANLGDIVGDLEGALAGMSDEQKKATLAQLGFNDRAQATLLTLLGTSDAIKEYESGLRNAGGTTAEVAEKQLQSFSAQMKIAKDNVIIAAIELGERLAPAVIKAAEVVRGLAEGFTSLSPASQTVITAVGAIAAAIGPLLFTVGKLTQAFIAARTAGMLMGVSIKTALIASGIGALLVGLGTAAVLLIENWDKVAPFFEDLWSSIKVVTMSFVDNFLALIQTGFGWIPGVEDKIGGLREKISNFIDEEAARMAARTLEREAQKAEDALTKTGEGGESAADVITTSFEELVPEVSNAAGEAGSAVVTAFDKAVARANRKLPELADKMREVTLELVTATEEFEVEATGNLQTLSDAAEKEADRLEEAYGSPGRGGVLGYINNAFRDVFGLDAASRMFDGFAAVFDRALRRMVDKVVEVIGFGDGIIPQMFADMTTVVLDEIARMAGEKGFGLLMEGLDNVISSFSKTRRAAGGASNALLDVGVTATDVGTTSAGAASSAGGLGASLAALGPAATIAASAMAALHIGTQFAQADWSNLDDAIVDFGKKLTNIRGIIETITGGGGEGTTGRGALPGESGWNPDAEFGRFAQAVIGELKASGSLTSSTPEQYRASMVAASMMGPVGERIFSQLYSGLQFDHNRLQSAFGIHPGDLEAQLAPFVHNLAEGGIVMPRLGGTLARIAEAGVPEVVLPLNKWQDIMPRMPRMPGGRSGGVYHVHLNIDGREVTDVVLPHIPDALRSAGVDV